jgi:hypothetical protein
MLYILALLIKKYFHFYKYIIQIYVKYIKKKNQRQIKLIFLKHYKTKNILKKNHCFKRKVKLNSLKIRKDVIN